MSRGHHEAGITIRYLNRNVTALYDGKTLMPIFRHILLLYWLLRCSNFQDITSSSEEGKHGYVSKFLRVRSFL